jgi:hypothetical protein
MLRIEGTTDGVTWSLFATTDTLNEARRTASKCILATNHMQVRIVGDE